mgnify:FL=1
MGEMIEHQCLALSYGVRLVDNGRDALLELQTKRYHLLITDILLPFHTGLEVISYLNQAGWEYPRKRIILTLINNEKTVFKAFHLGIDDYINKPLDLDFLMHRINKLLTHE